MATELADIANDAASRVGGFGDAPSGNDLITQAQITADTIPEAKKVNIFWPKVRKKVIKQFAASKTPFRETQKFATLGPELKQHDISIESITVSSTVVTITTQKAHGRPIGDNSDTVFLAEIAQDSDEDVDDIEQSLITSLNGTTETIIVTTTTAFTIATAGVDLTWVHQANTGIVSYVPEMNAYQYAFNLPSDYFCPVRQIDEIPSTYLNVPREYRYKVVLNKDGDGFIWLTNSLTNMNADSAYIEYCIDQETFALFSPEYEECLSQLLGAELAPLIGRDLETRQAMLVEYRKLTVPAAKAAIQSQLNSSAKFIPDFSGGRSGRGVIPRRGSDLGTYRAADGSRRSI